MIPYYGAPQELAAAAGGKIYDLSGAEIKTGYGGDDWAWTSFSNLSSVDYTVMVNGIDGVVSWDGTTFVTEAVTAPAGETWIIPAKFDKILSHMNRLWFADSENLAVYYLPVQTKSGALFVVPLNAIFKRGGSIRGIYTWSIDGGVGLDDAIAIFTSNGEVAIYSGVDPGHRLQAGRRLPLRRADVERQHHQFRRRPLRDDFHGAGADDDADPRRDRAAGQSRPQRHEGVRGRLEGPPRPLRLAGDAQPPHQPRDLQHADRQRQVPADGAQDAGADLDANGATSRRGAGAGSNNQTYFGSETGGIYLGGSEYLNDNGAAINADVRFAWSNFSSVQKKNFKMMRLYTITDGLPRPFMDLEVDYNNVPPTNQPEVTAGPSGGADWDTGDVGRGLLGVSHAAETELAGRHRPRPRRRGARPPQRHPAARSR